MSTREVNLGFGGWNPFCSFCWFAEVKMLMYIIKATYQQERGNTFLAYIEQTSLAFGYLEEVFNHPWDNFKCLKVSSSRTYGEFLEIQTVPINNVSINVVLHRTASHMTSFTLINSQFVEVNLVTPWRRNHSFQNICRGLDFK